MTCLKPLITALFLPTPSARRATQVSDLVFDKHFISTHALREEGDYDDGETLWITRISTHALREEGDCRYIKVSYCHTISTHALREEGDLSLFPIVYRIDGISTHALREEGDL